ncbi:MAG TPA: hypothetical protein VG294_12520 [Solirubrobacteraceae bacterium]|jgi:hypothetical protein|nr:hypothetical protein [Solirubrobacteraceae bacterium]
MRSAVIGLLVALALPASAVAASSPTTIAPPGNSGVSQYREDVPTAKGNRPSSAFTPGGGGSTGSGYSGGSVSPSTLRALDKQGSAGRKAAALAQATAPSTGAPAGPKTFKTNAGSQGSGASPVTSVVKALTGSSNGSGLGALLPIILIASLLGVSALAVLRRRGGPPEQAP